MRDEQELLLVRSTKAERHQLASFPDWIPRANPVVGIYGSNASGKSNLLHGMEYMRRAIAESHRSWSPEGGVPVDPFRLDREHPNMSSRFEVDAVADGLQFRYGFELNSERILREWMYAYPNGRRQTWFERDVDAEEEWYFGKALGGQNRVIAEVTRDNSLFLSAAAASKHKRLSPIFRWFGHQLRIANSSNSAGRVAFTFDELRDREDVVEQLTQLLRFADVGVCDVEVATEEMDEEERDRLRRLMRAVRREMREESADEEDDSFEKFLEQSRTSVKLRHLCRDGGPPVALPFEAESLGTQALVSLAGPIFQILREGGSLLVDEIDTSLHPRLVAEIIALFQTPETNPKQAQLIFTSHDTSLLGNMVGDSAILDRDQVWFVEKDESGASSVYALTEYSPRKAENLERGYLQGRYGAIPYIDHRMLASALSSTEAVRPMSSSEG